MSDNYYRDQINTVLTVNSTKYLKVQVSGDLFTTKWMNLNKESATELKKLCEFIINQEEEEKEKE